MQKRKECHPPGFNDFYFWNIVGHKIISNLSALYTQLEIKLPSIQYLHCVLPFILEQAESVSWKIKLHLLAVFFFYRYQVLEPNL